jgi:hypothetical protein
MTFIKYPRTRHMEGSRSQPGDEDLSDEPFSVIAGRPLVIEEKIDGANAGISFSANGELQLQSRGHYLTGGPREKHFALFKTWATTHTSALWERLGARYVAFGEWVLAKHTIFYDALPHYFLEFDVFDRETETFLSTTRRSDLWMCSPVVSVPVLWNGLLESAQQLSNLTKPSLYKSATWKEALVAAASEAGIDRETVQRETDPSEIAEGLYVKLEEGGVVRERYKFIRHSFLTSVVDSGSHWLHRPIVRNQLAKGTDIFASR